MVLKTPKHVGYLTFNLILTLDVTTHVRLTCSCLINWCHITQMHGTDNVNTLPVTHLVFPQYFVFGNFFCGATRYRRLGFAVTEADGKISVVYIIRSSVILEATCMLVVPTRMVNTFAARSIIPSNFEFKTHLFSRFFFSNWKLVCVLNLKCYFSFFACLWNIFFLKEQVSQRKE